MFFVFFSIIFFYYIIKIIPDYAKSWLILDVISCFPYDFISPPEQTGQGIARLPKLIRLLRLAKIAKVLRMSRILRRFESSMHIKYGIVRLTKFFLWSLVAAHWVGCAWFIIGTLDTYEGWVVSNLLTTELHGASVGEQYIASVYWSGKCGFDRVCYNYRVTEKGKTRYI